MARPISRVVIEGDYVDSFIYSGALFLVDFDGVLRTYPWKEIVIAGFNRAGRKISGDDFSLLVSGSVSLLKDEDDFDFPELFVDSALIKKFQSSELPLSCWPTDIGIYSNNIFVASEDGVSKRKFSWENGVVTEFQSPVLLWDELALKVSPNSMNRTAIAAGSAGVLTARSNNRKDTVQIFDSPCGDCEWNDTKLIANTINGALIAEFEEIPKMSPLYGSSGEYWNIVNSLKNKDPLFYGKIELSGSGAMLSWSGGDRLFAMDNAMQLYVASEEKIGENNSRSFEFESLNSVDVNGEHTHRVLSGKTGAFGTVVEFSDALLEFSEEGIRELANNPVRWRVFPRARNYANHLHVVENDFIKIYSFGLKEDSNFDKFGFSLESIGKIDE